MSFLRRVEGFKEKLIMIELKFEMCRWKVCEGSGVLEFVGVIEVATTVLDVSVYCLGFKDSMEHRIVDC